MGNKKRAIDQLPDSFSSEEAAGDFWDTHSATDYIEYLEPADDVIEIKQRVFEIQVSEDLFRKLQEQADSSHRSMPKVVDEILRKELTTA